MREPSKNPNQRRRDGRSESLEQPSTQQRSRTGDAGEGGAAPDDHPPEERPESRYSEQRSSSPDDLESGLGTRGRTDDDDILRPGRDGRRDRSGKSHEGNTGAAGEVDDEQ